MRDAVSRGFGGCESNAERIYLVVHKGNTECVGEEEDDFVLGVFTRGCGDVALETADLLNLAWRIASTMDIRSRS